MAQAVKVGPEDNTSETPHEGGPTVLTLEQAYQVRRERILSEIAQAEDAGDIPALHAAHEALVDLAIEEAGE